MTRDELVNIIEAVDVLASQTHSGRWECGIWGSIDDVFHTLFDDFDRRTEINDESLNEVYRLLDEMLVDIGDKPGEDFLRHHLWPRLVEAARTASGSLKELLLPNGSVA